MSIAVCRQQLPLWLAAPAPAVAADEPLQFDLWSAIQSSMTKPAPGPAVAVTAKYVHPLVRKSSGLMSQRSLEICTESLGSESGSDDFGFSLLSGEEVSVKDAEMGAAERFGEETWRPAPLPVLEHEEEEEEMGWHERKELVSVNYHCSSGARSPPRAFPPPLPSMSRDDGRRLRMRQCRRDGHLVIEAVSAPSQRYLHSQRLAGRLRLSFVDCSVRTVQSGQESDDELPERQQVVEEQVEDDVEVEVEDDEEDEEEEVEVVDRGIVVEVNVSTPGQLQSGGVFAGKVHRSRVVINKFLGSTPVDAAKTEHPPKNYSPDDVAAVSPGAQPSHLRRVPSATSTTALAAAVVAASAECDATVPVVAAASDAKLLFSSRRRGKEELLRCMEGCRQLRDRKLFIMEPYCVAT